MADIERTADAFLSKAEAGGEWHSSSEAVFADLQEEDPQFHATPAVADGQLLLRSDKFLYCIARS